MMALANRAVCLHKLDLLPAAVAAQERAIRLHLTRHAPSLVDVALVNLVGHPCADLTSSSSASNSADEPCYLYALY